MKIGILLHCKKNYKFSHCFTYLRYLSSSISLHQAAEMDTLTVTKKLDAFAPLHLAESWDNVGLLVQPYTQAVVKKMLLTNDLTETVLNEALENEVNFILSYHPPIFKGLKQITQGHWKEKIVSRCLAAGIAIYSPHTSYDSLSGGVNDWLVSVFGNSDVSPVIPALQKPMFDHEVTFSSYQADEINQAILIFNSNFGDRNDLAVDLVNNRILCTNKSLIECIGYFSESGVCNFHVKKLDSFPKLKYGMGRLAKVKSPVPLCGVISSLKDMTGLPHVRVALANGHTLDTVIQTGAVCAGSGSSVLRGVKADLIITGEMGHHDVLEFIHSNSSVILLEHSNSERGFLSALLKPALTKIFGESLDILISKADKDPLTVM